MYRKILIVSLLQVTLARNVPNARSFLRTNINPERQIFLRNPDAENVQIGNQHMQYRGANSNSDKLYLEELDTSEVYGHYTSQNGDDYEQAHHKRLNDERVLIPNNEYQERHDQRSGDVDSPDESNVNGKVNHSRRRYRIKSNQNKENSGASNEQYTLKTNLDSQNSPVQGSQYNVDDIPSHQPTLEEQHVRTNIKPIVNAETTTTVPVILVLPVTLKINPKLHSRIADAEAAKDTVAEVRTSDGMTFSAIDNPKPDTSDKATTDNEVRYSKNDVEEDKWIWNIDTTTSTTAVPIETKLPDQDLDDRTSFNGDGCPQGQAKIHDICVKKH